MTEIIIAVLGGSALSALITQIGYYISERRKRKDSKEDTEDTKDAAVRAVSDSRATKILSTIL